MNKKCFLMLTLLVCGFVFYTHALSIQDAISMVTEQSAENTHKIDQKVGKKVADLLEKDAFVRDLVNVFIDHGAFSQDELVRVRLFLSEMIRCENVLKECLSAMEELNSDSKVLEQLREYDKLIQELHDCGIAEENVHKELIKQGAIEKFAYLFDAMSKQDVISSHMEAVRQELSATLNYFLKGFLEDGKDSVMLALLNKIGHHIENQSK